MTEIISDEKHASTFDVKMQKASGAARPSI